ncbi:MAG: methylmalonyl-CoA mutase family protein [Bacteroidales bacterium]
MADKLFTQFPPISTQAWEEEIMKDLKGADYQRRLVWKTMEGFSVKPYYRNEDLAGIEHLDSSPGEFPFVRGTKPLNNWKVLQSYPLEKGVKECNLEAIEALARGVDSVAFTLPPSGIDTQQFVTLLQGIDLTQNETLYRGCSCSTPKLIESFIEAVEKLGFNPKEIIASFDLDPLQWLTTTGNYNCSDFENRLERAFELTKEYPGIKVVGVEGYIFNDAGASIVQELAFSLSMASEYLFILTKMGIGANEAVAKMRFNLSVGSNYFMEIAKFRAARVLWANIAKEWGVDDSELLKICVDAKTSRWNMTIWDPFVNMLRGTTEAMSAALAGVNSLEVLPYDTPFREPSEFSNRIARNTQIILKEEAHFDKVTDPAAGSYYIENLTSSIIEEGWKLFTQIEEIGGYREALKRGVIQKSIKEISSKRDANIATRREILLGTNQYPNFTEKAEDEVSLDMVTRKEGDNSSQERIVEPIEQYRGAQAFEAVRFATETSEKKPTVFMLTFGNLAMCRARAQFSSNFFGVAGFKIIDNNRFATVEEGVEAALASKAEIVVACSSDDEYGEAVPKINKLLNGAAILVVAGDPASRPELEAEGITNFIGVKSNLLETLKEYQNKLGI